MATKHRVDGMTCGGCANSVVNAIKTAVPTARVAVDLGARIVTVEGADDDAVAQAVQGAGYEYLGLA